MQALKLLSPTHGSVPDARGRQSALAWLAAGAALADVPAASGANHFYDPQTKTGWARPGRDLVAGLADKVRQAVGRAALPARGMPAPDWVVATANPFNVDAFYAQYTKAVTASTPGERSRHMAAALIAAGAILHALGDLGAPSRVRGDAAAHLEPLGGGPDDLGSRFERIAALAYGRLGVPTPARTITRTYLREFFTAPGTVEAPAAVAAGAAPVLPVTPMAGAPTPGEGLAELIARSYFSTNTLPGPARVSDDAKPVLARPSPALPARLNLMSASRDDGTVFRNSAGTCLARYAVESGVLAFSTDDDCLLEQVAAILPEVAAYETGLLQYLLRGDLTIEVADQITVSATGLAAGTLTLVLEDARGLRTPLASAASPVAGAEATVIAQVAKPAEGSKVYAVYRGVDAAGEPVVAVGASALVAP